jgi:polyribonucleotide 5'-hydroxyl-kinase
MTSNRTRSSSLIYVTGRPSAEYVSDETLMIPYTNLHLALEQMRIRSSRAARGSPPIEGGEGDSRPPRVLLIGPENSGKTSACKILINYAIRSPGQWSPILINLDSNDVS